MTPDVNVQLLNFPNSGKELVVKNEDDTYTILINAKLSHDAQIAAYQHAVEHIQNGDFDRDFGDVQEIEAIAHEEKPAAIAPVPAPASDPVITVAEKIKQPPRRRKRRRNQKQERYMMDRAEFIIEHCDSFALAEHQWLYGKDL